MYKCTECGTEYKIKPEYCDCGNDEFDEIAESFVDPEQESDVIPQVKVQPQKVKKPKKTFYEQYPQIERFVDSLDILSVIFFVICLILSLIIWIFAWNFEPNENKEEKQTKTTVTTEIPLIDKIWDNTPPAKQSKTKEDDEVFIPVPKVEIVPKRREVQRPVAKTTNKIIKTTPTPKATTKKTTTKTQNIIKKEEKKVKNNIQKPKQETKVTKPVVKTEKPNVVTAPTPKTQTQAKPQNTQNTQTTKPAKPTTTNNKELQNYKAALRQTLFARLNVGSIDGNGECIIHFSISSTGKLLNRGFVRQSSNTSLNNAIYRMLMNTPTYYAPPASYKGETLVLKFIYNNGYYEFGYQ